MKLRVAGVSLAMALAACSGAQNGATPMTLPSGNSGNGSGAAGGGGGGTTHYSVSAQRQAGVRKAATSALILVANEGGGAGGTISEFSENANGNLAPASVITNHNNGPLAIAFSSNEGIGFANGNINSGGQFGVETFSLAGDFLTGIEGFAKPTQTNAVAFDSTGQLFVSASLPKGGRASTSSHPELTTRAAAAKPSRSARSPTRAAWPSTATTFSTLRIAGRQRSTSSRRDQARCKRRSAEATPGWKRPARSPLTLRSTSMSSILRRRRSASSRLERPVTSRRSAPSPVRTPDSTEGMASALDSQSARRAVTSSSRTRHRMQSLSSRRLQAATLRQSKRSPAAPRSFPCHWAWR
jgi:hypothetical protein